MPSLRQAWGRADPLRTSGDWARQGPRGQGLVLTGGLFTRTLVDAWLREMNAADWVGESCQSKTQRAFNLNSDLYPTLVQK